MIAINKTVADEIAARGGTQGIALCRIAIVGRHGVWQCTSIHEGVLTLWDADNIRKAQEPIFVRASDCVLLGKWPRVRAQSRLTNAGERSESRRH